LGHEHGVVQLDGGWEVTVSGIEDTADIHGFLSKQYSDASFFKKALEEPAKMIKQTLKELGIIQLLVGPLRESGQLQTSTTARKRTRLQCE
jgi:hypothetical protein